MMIALAVAAGELMFWLLYTLVRFVFHTRLDVWPLVLFYFLHTLPYLIVFVVWAHHSDAGTAFGWFVIGPLLGGLWLTVRIVPRDSRRPGTIAMAELNLLVTSGALIAVLLGLAYSLLKVIGLAL
jgi:hypothetical protein